MATSSAHDERREIEQNYTSAQLCKQTFSPVDFTFENVKDDEVNFCFIKHTNPDDQLKFNIKNVNDLRIEADLPTKIFLHGWNSCAEASPWYGLLKNEYFKKGPHNIIYVDWNIPSSQIYSISTANINPVGKIIALVLINLKIPPSNIHVLGHSLGGQLASYVGKKFHQLTSKKVGRITGLDPAGPKFEHEQMTTNLRLSMEDAEFVDVIHTDIGCSGYAAPCGHVDFYPNFGYNQPGCPTRDNDHNCSHARSTLFFVDSVNNSKCKAIEAKAEGSLKLTKISVVEGGKETIFGENVPRTARGVFYIKTNSEAPYFT